MVSNFEITQWHLHHLFLLLRGPVCDDACFLNSWPSQSSANLCEVQSKARGNNGKMNVACLKATALLERSCGLIFGTPKHGGVWWKRRAWQPVFSPVAFFFLSLLQSCVQTIEKMARIDFVPFRFLSLIFEPWCLVTVWKPDLSCGFYHLPTLCFCC